MENIMETIRTNLQGLEAFISLDLRMVMFCIGGALICGLIIYMIYKYFYKGVLYNENFNILLVMICVISSFMVMIFSVNIIAAFGMVAGLGMVRIIRFRTTIKDPLDIGFLFWSLGAGIVAGVGHYKIAVLVTIMVGIMYILLTKLIRGTTLYLLVISYEKEAEEKMLKTLSDIKYKVKNKSQSSKGAELIVQFTTKSLEPNLTNKISAVKGVKNVSIVEYDGDFAQ